MDTISDEGWVSLHRKLIDNPIFKDAEALQLFLYCLLRANYKPNDFLFNGQVVHLERGQFIFGLRKASKALKMSIRKLRTRLLILEKLGITTHRGTHRFSIITVCNYNHYQNIKNEKGHNKRHTDDTLTTTNNKENNNTGRSQKQTDPRVKEFLSFWDDLWVEEIGSGYVHSYGMEGKMIKTLLKVHDLTTLQEMAKKYFKDERCQKYGVDIRGFFYETNRRTSLKSLSPLEQAKKEIRNQGSMDS